MPFLKVSKSSWNWAQGGDSPWIAPAPIKCIAVVKILLFHDSPVYCKSKTKDAVVENQLVSNGGHPKNWWKNVLGVKLGQSKDDSKGWISRNGSLALIVVFFYYFQSSENTSCGCRLQRLECGWNSGEKVGKCSNQGFLLGAGFVKWIRTIS